MANGEVLSWLTEASIRALILAAAVALLLWVLRVRVAKVQHAAWTGVMVAMLLMPVLVAVGPRMRIPLIPELRPVAGERVFISEPARNGAAGGAGESPPQRTTNGTGGPVLLWVYGAGLLAMALRMAWGLWQVWRLRRASQLVEGRWTSTQIAAPVTVGPLWHRVILPRDWRQWEARQLSAVLAHEGEHLRRRDPLTQFIALVNRAVFWFHPFAWWLERKLAALAEQVCDDAVIEAGHDAREYSECLIAMARRVQRKGPGVYVGVMAMPGAGLDARVRAMLTETRPKRLSASRLTILTTVGALAVWMGSVGEIVRAQTPNGLLPQGSAFEVATIKPNQSPDGPRLFQALPGGQVRLVNQTVRELIYSSYQMQDFQIIGGPGWLADDRFDIEAKAANNAPPPSMLRMLRQLLADRFQLAMHTETRELPIYRMVLASREGKTGPGLKQSVCIPGAQGQLEEKARAACVNREGRGSMVAVGATMKTLANRLGRLAQIGRPIVNETGLTGVYDFQLTFSPDPAANNADTVSIFTALQEQLGIRLESGRGPVEIMVIDKAERPSEN